MKYYKSLHSDEEFLVSEEFQLTMLGEYHDVEFDPTNFESKHFLKIDCKQTSINKSKVLACFAKERKLAFARMEASQKAYMATVDLDNRLKDFDWEGYL